MNYENMSLNWEEVFIQESIELEEKMASLHLVDYQKSRLRISLESNILSWPKYQAWFSAEVGCSCINPKISTAQLRSLSEHSKKSFEDYQDHKIWNEDLMPFMVWDGHLIVLGLAYNEKLTEIPDCIFILAEPFVLTFIADTVFGNNEELTNATSQAFNDLESSSGIQEDDSILDGLDLAIAAPSMIFDSASLISEQKQEAKDQAESNNQIWDYLSERHDEYSFEAKKQFSAFAVLKIVDNKTTVFKLDSELERLISDKSIFEYDLRNDTPFKKIIDSGASQAFSISQLRDTILDFKYVCITALKRGPTTVGFLVGLKSNRMAEDDQTLLEDLAKESA